VTTDDERRTSIRRNCDRFLSHHPPRTTGEWLAELAEYAGDREPDRYGEGELIESLETRVAELLGTEAAAFMPSGTMAQQAGLRVWADETGLDTVALHPLTHLEQNELRALWELHHLRPLFLTDENRQPTVADLAGVPEPIGTAVVELPLRLAGHTLPSWDELTAFCAAARERDASLHFDGARLWESAPHLGHSLPEITGLADSVYVSFYKSLGGISGAALAGSQPFVDAAKRWRHRHGGTLVTHFPAVLAAHRALDEVLPQIPSYVEHARAVATALAALQHVRIYPEPPHTNAFRIYLEAGHRALTDAALAHAEEYGVWTWTRFWPAEVPGWSLTELSVGEATMGWRPDQVAALVVELLDRAKPSPDHVANADPLASPDQLATPGHQAG
jgi:threonine aldolase